MTELKQILERRITIAAHPDTVFRFFTDPERFARGWGEGMARPLGVSACGTPR